MSGRNTFMQTREVDNPSLTNGLAYSEQRNAHLKVRVDENAMTRIGALCFVRKREPHHERTAELFKNLYEARYGVGTPAMDASREPVDRSIVAHDSGMAAKIDRTNKLQALLYGFPSRNEGERGIPPQITKEQGDRLIAALVLGISCADQADTMRSGQPNQRQVGKCVDDLLDVLDTVATIWGMQSRRAA